MLLQVLNRWKATGPFGLRTVAGVAVSSGNIGCGRLRHLGLPPPSIRFPAAESAKQNTGAPVRRPAADFTLGRSGFQ